MIYAVDLLMVENVLMSGSFGDASYVVAWFFCSLAMELMFVGLVVRRESVADLWVLQALAIVPILNPILEEVFLAAENPQGVGIGMGQTEDAKTVLWLSQQLRAALLSSIILCAFALALTARRVRREYAWRTQNAEGRARRLASGFGAAFYLDAAITLSLGILVLSQDVIHILGADASSVGTSVGLLCVTGVLGAAYLLLLFLAVARLPCMGNAPTQRALLAMGSLSALALAAWLAIVSARCAERGWPVDADGTVNTLRVVADGLMLGRPELMMKGVVNGKNVQIQLFELPTDSFKFSRLDNAGDGQFVLKRHWIFHGRVNMVMS